MTPRAISLAEEVVKYLTVLKSEDQRLAAMSIANIQNEIEDARQGDPEMIWRLQYSLGSKGILDLHWSPETYTALSRLCEAFHEALTDDGQ